MSTSPSRLNAAAHKLLTERSRTLTLDKIAADTGLNIFWLTSYSCGQIVDPKVSKIETLYEYLSKTTLQIAV